MGAEVLVPIIASVAGAVVSSALAPKQKQSAPPEPEKPPQASQAPEAGAFRRQNAAAEAGPMTGPNNTLLTGPSGVSNDLLSLGKNTLLGA